MQAFSDRSRCLANQQLEATNMSGADAWNASTDDVTETCDAVTSSILCGQRSNSSSRRWSGNATSYIYSDIRPITLALYLVTFVFGLVGNTLVIYVIAKYQKIRVRSVSNYYIWNLAFADELFVLTLPFLGYATYANNWPFDALSCKVSIIFIRRYKSQSRRCRVTVLGNRAGFKCVEAQGRIIIRGPYGFLLLMK